MKKYKVVRRYVCEDTITVTASNKNKAIENAFSDLMGWQTLVVKNYEPKAINIKRSI